METRDRIVQSALQQFCRYGVRSVTMDDLAREIGVSKRTIYEHFGDKKKLLRVTVETLMLDFKEKALGMIGSADNVIQGLVQMFTYVFENSSQVSPQFYRDLKRHYPEVNELMCGKNHIRDYGVTQMLFQKGKEQGVFRENLHVELVNSILQRLFMIDKKEFNQIEGLTLQDVFRDVIFAYLLGLATDKGREIIWQEQEQILNSKIPESPHIQ